MKLVSFALAALLVSVSPGLAGAVVGRASVVDGDTLDIRGTRIRLHAVDAPESAQTCRNAGGREYRCGQQAALALADHIGAASVSCEQKDVDRYHRIVAVCSARGEDLNAWLVRQGHALAYRQYGTDYVAEEDAARRARRGIWAGAFTPPWDWRKAQHEAAASDGVAPQVAPGAGNKTTANAGKTTDCRIKGNISRKGEHVFHVPGSRDYARTQLDEAAGERWFCSTEEAVAAGWRAPRG